MPKVAPWALALLALTACGAASPIGPWQATAVEDHPLTGRIWSVHEARFVTPEALRARLASARVVLLGEKHDNPDHHRLHGWLIEGLAGPGVPLLFEQLDHDAAEAIAGVDSAEGLRAAAGWDRSGWPAFSLYRPKFEAAYRQGAAVGPAHPPRGAVRAAMDRPLDSYPAELGLGRPLPPDGAAALEAEIEASHCGHADGPLVERMLRAQRFKDAVMARAIRDAAGHDGRAVLIAGNGHVRQGMGVPVYLRGLDPVAVGVIEVSRGRLDPAEAAGGRFDYVWFTPRVDERDPCAAFAEQLERIKAMKRPTPRPPAASQPTRAPAAP